MKEKKKYRVIEYVGGPEDGRTFFIDPEGLDALDVGREIRIPDGSVFLIERLEGETIFLRIINWVVV